MATNESRSLAKRYVAARGRASASSATLERQLRAMLAAGHHAWPDVQLAPEQFVDQLARHHSEGALEAVHASDLYLACACAAQDPRALAHFDRHFLAHTDGAVARLGQGHDFAEEVRQRLRARLFVGDPPKIASYTGSGALGGFVRVAALRTALNLSREGDRRRKAERRDEPSLDVIGDAELNVLRTRHGREVEAALAAAFTRLDGTQRHLLRLHYLDGISLEKIGRMQQVNRSTASRQLAAARRFLLEEAKRELVLTLGITPASLESLLRVLHSQLDVSLNTLLRSGP